MASSIYQPPSMPDTKKDECDACACHACGGLECLCRPRFFAGQLLTDETLNRLEHYIVEKNKLHNRYLHGWGVVCGLEVVCSPCNAVTVRAGYALSPCGEDIIVCKDAPVNVCDLINQCRDKRRDWECEPYATGQNPDCRDVEEDWILTVRYDERGSRGITALKGGSNTSCGSSCSCGSSSASGCSCHGQNGNGGSHKSAYATASVGSSVKHGYRQAAATTIAAQCEPTLTCEGYVFEVCKAKDKKNDEDNSQGAMIQRMVNCFNNLKATLPQEPSQTASPAELYQWCCALKEQLQNNLFDYPVYNCQLSQLLSDFPCPDPANMSRDQYVNTVQSQLSLIGAEYVRYCFCSPLLPPCPEAVCDPRVPLATVTVRKNQNGQCRIVRVCNLEKRKFVTTFISLGYWLSILRPILFKLRKGLEALCCKPFGRRFNLGNFNMASSTNATGEPAPVTNKRGFKAFASRVWANRGATVDAQTLFLGAIGARDEKGRPYLSETELANPFYTVMLNNFAGPLLAKLPDNTPELLKRAGRSFASGRVDTTAPGGETAAGRETANIRNEELENLKTRVSELQRTVERQSEMINELRARTKPNK
jgi:hypothetical protein